MTPVDRVLKRLQAHSDLRETVHELQDMAEIASGFEEWRKVLEAELDYVRKEVI